MSRWLWVVGLWGLSLGVVSATSLPQYWTYTQARRAEAHGRAGEAVSIYSKLLVNDPDNIVLMRSLADALYHKGDYTKAGELYEKIGRRSPKSEIPSLLYNQGNAAFQVGRYAEAVSWYRKALSLNPRDVQAKHNLELAQRRMQDKNPAPPPPPPPPHSMLNAMDQMERESRHQRKQNPPIPPRNVERDW